CRRSAAGGDNHGDLPANEIGSKGRQSIVSGFCPTIFDLNVLALNVSYLFQSLPKRAQTVGVRVRRGAAKETNYRPRLLRTCSKRPRGRGANNHFDELAPSHCLPPRRDRPFTDLN